MSFGGFLGLGQSYHPLPWRVLTYDTGKGGYVVDLDKDRLQGAPSYPGSEAPDWSDPGYGKGVDAYYYHPDHPGGEPAMELEPALVQAGLDAAAKRMGEHIEGFRLDPMQIESTHDLIAQVFEKEEKLQWSP